MHRFRKRSDAKTTLPPLQTQPLAVTIKETSYHQEQLPELPSALPSADDFRTSLILPDLSRRFSLLRDSSGDPLSLDILKSRLADQRARGAENHITEEEEDMILETLGLRPRTPLSSAERSQENLSLEGGSMRQSIRSSNTPSSVSPSISSSPSGRSKRYSNNLFGSGRLRDYSYSRMRAQSRKDTSSVATVESQTPSSSQNSTLIADGTASSSSGTPPTSHDEPSSEYQANKSMASAVFKRGSLALEEAIRELEEDADDEIVMPRSAPITRTSLDQHNTQKVTSRLSGTFEAGMAISSDTTVRTEEENARMSPILSRVSPGYVPGMPRPMTPHDDLEHDTLRSHSTTPRATPSSTSPLDMQAPTPTPSTRPHSPYTSSFLQRKTSVQNGERNKETDAVPAVSSYHWRRPSSPLSGQPHQPMSIPQRPSTPSNVTWTVPASKHSPQKPTPHSRNGSWFSDSGAGSIDTHGSYENSKSSSRSLRSPALPDSPVMGHSTMMSVSSTFSANADIRPISPVSGLGPSQSFSAVSSGSRAIRSTTPTQAPSRSPTSPTFSSFDASTSKHGSRRSSKQNSVSSPFSLTAFNPVVFHPIASSSRSSLESMGSSYHSGEGDQKDRLAAFVDVDLQQPLWHDISFPSQSNSTTTGGSPDLDWNAEDFIRRYAGLNKADIAAVQDKLVGFATEKAAMESENRERAPSVRKRRPSTSQSNYSYNGRDTRIASPPPQSSTTNTLSSEQMSKASALLKSVVDSIQMPPPSRAPAIAQNEPKPDESFLPDFGDVADDSPTVRRNRDLAQILFGDDNGDIQTTGSSNVLSSSQADSDLNFILEGENKHPSPPTPSTMSSNPLISPTVSYTPSSNPSNAHLPRTPESEADLAREVQRKAEAAMQALKKPSKEGLASSPSLPRKRINPHQISTPTLVSASTSVDTIPLRTPTNSQPASKLGSRFKKLRGTLRKNTPMPTGEEVTPYPLDIRTAPLQTQTAQYDQRKLHPIEGIPTSATELGKFNIPIAPIPSPPASAGPGLKGFMARFRGKQRVPESPVEQREMHLRPPVRSDKPVQQSPPASAPAMYEDYSSKISAPPALQLPHPTAPSDGPFSGKGAMTDESTALRQLFDAASNLGLDQQKLNDLLLVRSGSTSSKSTDLTMLTRNTSVKTEAREQTQAELLPPSISTDDPGSRSRPVSRRPSTRQHAEGSRKARERTTDPSSVVVRRTLILPSDARALAHLSTLVPSVPNKRHRRASGASTTSKNVPDRTPTPPPRSPTGRRFSTDTPPPVPPVPRPENYLMVPNGSHEKSGSAYDSFYEMYTDENKGSTSDHNPRATLAPDATAVEFIELASGETIWQIVNGLRDDDESVYTGRASFDSGYDNDENVQVYVKEHSRTGSKGSASSFFSRKKSMHSKSRPETRVYYGSANQIGLLIEGISQGMDAGSFNIMPDYSTPAGHSATSSLSETDMHHWTVEERLERMLGRLQRGET
ncbi:hypothetical protein Moror_6487 [Moniliophthora roreri MCA 2997]|uniref:Uncharacterized protein n=1 Tax=Moniliophthora roreri (strain MCA 2997) TaxID=1381753 RepID=V2YYX7_MONRO|nr:hypothetical protein Moror_6487 [Moniliophthora roreri MCA 2997]